MPYMPLYIMYATPQYTRGIVHKNTGKHPIKNQTRICTDIITEMLTEMLTDVNAVIHAEQYSRHLHRDKDRGEIR